MNNVCECRACLMEADKGKPLLAQRVMTHMVLCSECGNKRCPHANDHRHACTHSNEPGQHGSAYPRILHVDVLT